MVQRYSSNARTKRCASAQATEKPTKYPSVRGTSASSFATSTGKIYAARVSSGKLLHHPGITFLFPRAGSARVPAKMSPNTSGGKPTSSASRRRYTPVQAKRYRSGMCAFPFYLSPRRLYDIHGSRPDRARAVRLRAISEQGQPKTDRLPTTGRSNLDNMFLRNVRTFV
jgi:hypothetical protein